MAGVATCIGCGCDDYRACWDDEAGQPCGWLRVNRDAGLGVCSTCPEHTHRWDRGNTALAVRGSLSYHGRVDLKFIYGQVPGLSRTTDRPGVVLVVSRQAPDQPVAVLVGPELRLDLAKVPSHARIVLPDGKVIAGQVDAVTANFDYFEVIED